MKIKLDSKEVLEVTKTLKSGYIDISKLKPFSRLLRGYNPHTPVTEKEMKYYLDCLKKGWGYTPSNRADVINSINEIDDVNILSQWEDLMKDGTIYEMLVKDAFFGLVALRGLGGVYEDVEPDFSFIENE